MEGKGEREREEERGGVFRCGQLTSSARAQDRPQLRLISRDIAIEIDTFCRTGRSIESMYEVGLSIHGRDPRV